jgi:hypothetical protein
VCLALYDVEHSIYQCGNLVLAAPFTAPITTAITAPIITTAIATAIIAIG